MSGFSWRSPYRFLISKRRRWLPTKAEIENRRLIEEHQRFLSQGGEQLRYDYTIGTDETVLDLGGYRGDWTNEVLTRFGCRAIVFEPGDANFEALVERFSGDERVTLCHFGVGASSRVDRIALADDRSSLFTRKSRHDPHQRVEIRDIAGWWDVDLLPSVAVMKVNIEGGEYEVLPRMLETGLIERVLNLQVQFHSFVPDAEAKMEQIAQSLSRTHIQTYDFRYIWENWRRLDQL